MIGTIMAERFTYLPLIGVIGGTIAVIQAWRWRVPTGAPAAVMVIVVALLTVRTWARNEDWRDGEHLFSSVIRTYPNSMRGYKGLAGALDEEGRHDERLDEQIALGEKAMAILDRWPLPVVHQPTQQFIDLAHYYVRKGDQVAAASGKAVTEEGPAREWYRKAVPILDRAISCDRAVNEASRRSRLARGMAESKVYDVGQPQIYQTAAKVHLRLGDPWRALADARYAVHLMPGDSAAWRLVSYCERVVGHPHEAAVASLQALAMGDDSAGESEEIQSLYAQLTPGVPAVLMNEGKPALNGGNAQLRADLDEAFRDLVKRAMDQQQEHEARRVAEWGIKNFGCTEGTFAGLLK
jgi:hypothetical protein